MISTLIVEDDYHVATIHAAYVRRVRGFTVAGHASSVASARAEIRRLAPTLVLLDLYLPDGHGLDLARETLPRKDHQRPDFLVITAARDVASVRAAMQLGTVHYMVKPFSFAQLEERLNAYRGLRGRLERIDEAEQHRWESAAPPPSATSPSWLAKARSSSAFTTEPLAGPSIATGSRPPPADRHRTPPPLTRLAIDDRRDPQPRAAQRADVATLSTRTGSDSGTCFQTFRSA